jgi:NADPH2:quinone reductase
MRAVLVQKTGGPEVLELVDVPATEPGPGEIRVRHEAIGVNFIDVYFRTGLYPVTLPSRIGQEAAGIVEAAGEGVTRFKTGDRVAYATGGLGAYAEANTLKADRVVAIPDGVTAAIAAAALLKGMTAEYLVRRTFHVKQGHTILVHAAAGGVGSILTQWAAAIGATVIGVVGSNAKAEIARRQGCAHVLTYDSGDIAKQVRDLTDGVGVPVVYDSVGKSTFDASIASLARRGMMVTYGNASGAVPPFEPLRLSRAGSLFLTRPTLFDYVATTEELDDSAGALFEMIGSGKIKVEIGQQFPLADVRKAHEALEARKTTGSTVLLP